MSLKLHIKESYKQPKCSHKFIDKLGYLQEELEDFLIAINLKLFILHVSEQDYHDENELQERIYFVQVSINDK